MEYFVKKLLIGLTLLASVMSFANNCEIVVGLSPWSKDEQGLTNKPLKILKQKGYVIVENPTDYSRYLLMNFNCRHGIYDERLNTAYCSKLEATVYFRDSLSKDSPGLAYTGTSNPFLDIEASADKALEKALLKIPRCNH